MSKENYESMTAALEHLTKKTQFQEIYFENISRHSLR